MGRKIAVAVTALLLIGFGWVIGRAQVSQPDFAFIVNAPQGETTIECVQGCSLMYVGMGTPSGVTPKAKVQYSCSGSERCESGRIGGWTTH
jgi:hypothetical protein